MSPILIIGTQRSGSNLLRLLLNQYPQIAAPHPPHLLQIFSPLLPIYGDLGEKHNFRCLVTDICEYVAANPVPWTGLALDPNEIAASCQQPNLIHVYRAVYEAYATAHGAKYWCCKSMANLYYIPALEQQGLASLYIHLVRDGRDVAVSFKKAIVGEKHCYHLARQWSEDQRTAIEYCERYAPDRYIRIYYEQLITDTRAALQPLLDRLGLSFEERIYEFFDTEEARNTAQGGKMWQNVARAIMPHNAQKYLEHLSTEELAIFEAVADEELRLLGYPLSSATPKAVISQSEIKTYDAMNQQLKLEALQLLDPAGLAKRKAQERIVNGIKSRK